MTPRGLEFYRLLLRLYPAEFRARYGRAMTDFHRDRIAMARVAGDSLALLWLRASLDIVASACAERLRALTDTEAVMHTVWQDLGYALRGLARRPTFTAIIVATIALGVGANAAIFSVVNGVLLQPLPYPHPEQVVSFGHEPPTWLSSEPDFIDYHRELKMFHGLAAFTNVEATLTDVAEPERLRLVRATEDFFAVLGVQPLLGRTFAADESGGNPPRVVVLSYGLWQRRFGGDKSIVGKTMALGGIPRTIVGVMPAHFDYPKASTDLWSPLPPFHPDRSDRDNNYLFMVGRLAPGATVQSAFSEANGLAKRFMRDFPQSFNPNSPLTPVIVRVGDQLVGPTRPYLFALLGAVGFVLLIACANVANLLLVRGEGRHKEMAVRSALGASGFRLLSHMLTESTVLAMLGGGLGLLIAWGGDRVLLAVAPASIPRLDAISVDWHVVAFTAIATLITGFLIGVVPAWRAAGSNAAGTLKEGGRSMNANIGSRTVRRGLVALEVALAVVTLSGAGMLLRSLWHLEQADLGFEPRGALTATVALAPRQYNDERATTFFKQVLERLRATPGVVAAGAAGWLPVVDAGGLRGFTQEGSSYPAGQAPEAVPQQVTPGYFAAFGLPLVAGREFTDADGDGALPVAIVSERFARFAWPAESAIGKRFKLGGPAPFLTVVGVVRDIRARGFADTPEQTMYFPFAQSTRAMYYQPRNMAVIARTSGDPTQIAPALRNIVHSLDRMAPVSEIRTLADVAATSISNRRFNTALLAGFAILALVLSGIGTYGVISYGVTQRAFEIGVRMALGADGRSVLSLVMLEAAGMCCIGLGVGLVASVALERSLRSMLVGLPGVDVVTLGATSLLLGAVAIAACVVPAKRALNVNPLEALRG